jgi:2-polyprenyl-3-methyl-5-hydroxy-6-metoxy-1,4-benzoquinol methylase
MNYDPIKDRLGGMFNRRPFLQRVFYALLGMFFLRTWYVKREVRTLMSAMGASPHILDAGTGFGQYSWWILKRWKAARVLAVDVKTDYLMALGRFLKHYEVDDRIQLQTADLTLDTFEPVHDLVLSVDVMEHIEDDRAVFRNMYASMRAGGYVLVNTPSDQGGSDVADDADESFIGEHVRDGYNVEDLREKLESAGFVVTKSIYTYGRSGSMAWRLLIKWPMLLLNSSFAWILVLPFYYMVALVPGLLLNRLDMVGSNERGTGLIVIAQKPA